ncbi:MAG: hypothetical protein R3F65_06910 [bacterium]
MRRLALLALLLPLAACDDHDHDDEHAHEDLTAEACEHGAEGPFQAVTAAAPVDAPAIQGYSHTRVDITLPAGPDGNGGAVAFNVSEAGDYNFFLTADVPIAFLVDRAPLPIEDTVAVTECEAIAVHHTVELPAGEVFLMFGPTAATEVGVVFEAADHEHAH